MIIVLLLMSEGLFLLSRAGGTRRNGRSYVHNDDGIHCRHDFVFVGVDVAVFTGETR